MDRKTFFPPRPRRKRSKARGKEILPAQTSLSGLSQDSGLGSSQECQLLGLEPISECPNDLKMVAADRSLSKSCTSVPVTEKTSAGNIVSSLSDAGPSCSGIGKIVVSKDKSVAGTTHSEESGSQKKVIPTGGLTRIGDSKKCKRAFSESSLSSSDNSDVPRCKQMKTTSQDTETAISEPVKQHSASTESKCNEDVISGATSVDVSSVKDSAVAVTETRQSKDDKSKSTELCITCNATPKNGIFLHGNIAHMCCCYQCAIKTWRTIKRCPVCGRRVNNVVKLYT